MTRAYVAVLAAGLMAGGFGCDRKQSADSGDNRTPGQKTADAVKNGADKVADTTGKAVDKMASATQPSADSALKNSREALGNVVEAAVSKNGLSDVVKNLAKADRDRIGSVKQDDADPLNQVVGRFLADWKTKYNQDFKLSDKQQVVFGAPVQVQIGNLTEAQVAANRTATGTTPPGQVAGAENNATTVVIPPGHDAKEVVLHLMNEGSMMNSWKINVPDTFDGDKLRKSLVKHLNMVENMKANWPADANEAYRAVAHHVLEALTDTSAAD